MAEMNDDTLAEMKKEIREALFEGEKFERAPYMIHDIERSEYWLLRDHAIATHPEWRAEHIERAVEEVRRDLARERLEEEALEQGLEGFGYWEEETYKERRDRAEDRALADRKLKQIAVTGAAALALTAGVVWVARDGEPPASEAPVAEAPAEQDAPEALAAAPEADDGADGGADDESGQPAAGDAPRLDEAGPIAIFLDNDLAGIRSGPDGDWFTDITDAVGDWIHSIRDAVAGMTEAPADIVQAGRDAVDYESESELEAFIRHFGNTDYPCGRSDDVVTVVCPDGAGTLPGPGQYAMVVTWLAGEIGPDTAASELVYGYVVDSDGDPANDWQPQGDYTWDFFQGTDTWFELVGAVGSDGIDWRIDVSQVTTEQQIVSADLPVRAMVTGNAVVWIVPAESVPVDAPYRVSAFAHDGTYAPDSSGGDVPGPDPTGGLIGG